MLNFDLPVNTEVDAFNGFNNAVEDIKTKRLANYKALQEIGKTYADSGKELSIDDWANMSKSVLGPAGFLTSTAPTADMLNALAGQQQAAAKLKAEEIRRSQFRADQEEKKSVEADVKARYLAGDNDAEVDEYVRNMYGEERAAKLRPNLVQMRQTAMHEGTASGMEFGAKMFQSTDEAEAYLSENGSHLSDFEKNGIRTGAAANQQRMEGELEKFAIERGGNGFIGDAQDELAIQNRIKLAFPKASVQQVDSMTKRYMATAQAAAQAKQVADEDKAMQEVRRMRAANADRDAATKAQLQQGEYDRLDKAAKTMEQTLSTPIARQNAYAEDLAKKKKRSANEEAALAMLHNVIIPDLGELMMAVEKGDIATINRIKTESQPIAEFQTNARNMSRLITGRYDNLDQFYSSLKASGVGASPAAITSMGKAYQMHANVAGGVAAATPSRIGGLTSSESSDMLLMGMSPGLASSGSVTPSKTTAGSEMRATARADAERVKQKFITETADYINNVREIMVQNRSVGAKPEDVLAREKAIIQEKVRQFMAGANDGTNKRNLEMEVMLTMQIQNTLGQPPMIVRQETPVEAYNREMKANEQALMLRSGAIPGAVRRNPRLDPF